MKQHTHAAVTIAVVLALAAGKAGAGIVVTPDHIVSGSAGGTLVAIDTPYCPTIPTNGPLGPTWADPIAPADNGWRILSGSQLEADHGAKPWAPDGAVAGQARIYRLNSSPGSSYTFSQADAGINLPDGALINAVYATWATRNKDGTTWNYSEVTTGTTTVANNVAPTADLVLKWTDDAAGVHNGNYQRLFTGPITVTGDDGFRLGATKASQNAGHIDAVVLDVTIPAAFPTTGALILVK